MNITKIKEEYGNIVWLGKKLICGMPISFTAYILTDSKLIIRTGLLNLVEREIELYRVKDRRLSLPLTQRLFNCGTIILSCADLDSPEIVLYSIKSPRKVKQLLDAQIDKQQSLYSMRGKDMPSSLN